MAEKKIIVLGGVGKTKRENRDDMRVIFRGGCSQTLKAHISQSPPLVIKKWIKN